MAYIDFRKAYDSVSHGWIFAMLEIFKFHKNIVNTLRRCMAQWQTRMLVTSKDQSVTTEPIVIARGIFQGDSLSPLLFCLALTPISRELERMNCGYEIKFDDLTYMIAQLLFMDDIKLYSPSSGQLQSMIRTVELVANDVGLTFGLSKCAVLHMVCGRIDYKDPILGCSGQEFQQLDRGGYYKYLSFMEATDVPHETIKSSLMHEFGIRLKQLLESHLNAGNLARAVNCYALPVLSYSFGIIHLTRHELKQIDRMFRKTLTDYGVHHPRAAVERLYLARKNRGQGFLLAEELHDRIVLGIYQYLCKEAEHSPRLALLLQHHGHRKVHSVVKCATEFASTLMPEGNASTLGKATIKEKCHQKMVSLREKPLHGQFCVGDLSFSWLRVAMLKPPSEGKGVSCSGSGSEHAQFASCMGQSCWRR